MSISTGTETLMLQIMIFRESLFFLFRITYALVICLVTMLLVVLKEYSLINAAVPHHLLHISDYETMSILKLLEYPSANIVRRIT